MIIAHPERFALAGIKSEVIIDENTYSDGTKDYKAYNINQVLRGYSNARKVEVTRINGYKAIIGSFSMNGLSVTIFRGDVYIEPQTNGLIWSSGGSGEYWQTKDYPISIGIMKGVNRMCTKLKCSTTKREEANTIISDYLDKIMDELKPSKNSICINSLWDDVQ